MTVFMSEDAVTDCLLDFSIARTEAAVLCIDTVPFNVGPKRTERSRHGVSVSITLLIISSRQHAEVAIACSVDECLCRNGEDPGFTSTDSRFDY